MKFLFLLLSWFVCQSVASAHSLVFVHIGPKIPLYVGVAVAQARLFNPDCPIYLVGNKEALHAWKMSQKILPICVACESLTKSKSHRKFAANSAHDSKSFEGFWVSTSERFFYLEEVIRDFQLKDVFHLENDVMLYADLNSLLPVFQAHYRGMIGATFDSDSRCIPGFIYISDEKPISKLGSFMADQAPKGMNDMQIIQEFKRLKQGIYIDHLPIIFPEYVAQIGLKNSLGQTSSRPDPFHRHFDRFQAIFDAAAIGQYLGGISPRNGDPNPGFINETCLFNPMYLNFNWKIDSKGRCVPYASFQGIEYPIINLHIHSKNLHSFYSGEK